MRLIFLHFSIFVVFLSSDSYASPFLYKVSKGQSESFLFGTMHGGISLADLPLIVVETLKSADQIAVEVIIEPIMINNYFYDFNQFTLAHFNFSGDPLTQEETLSLQENWGLSPDVARKARSHDCSLITYGGAFGKKRIDYEVILLGLVKKNIIQLDSQELFDQASKETGQSGPSSLCKLPDLMKTYSPESILQMQNRLIKAYLDGNESDFTTNDKFSQIRNTAWIKTLKPLFSSKKVFVAVGAAHLFGDKGLIKILRDDGFKVVRMKP